MQTAPIIDESTNTDLLVGITVGQRLAAVPAGTQSAPLQIAEYAAWRWKTYTSMIALVAETNNRVPDPYSQADLCGYVGHVLSAEDLDADLAGYLEPDEAPDDES